jgi:hypothetical protein
MTPTGCRIRFDCPVGPAGVIIDIPCSGVSFPQFFFFGLHRSVFLFRGAADELAAVALGREARLKPSSFLPVLRILNTAAPLRPIGIGYCRAGLSVRTS